jgi:hypothetical protein
MSWRGAGADASGSLVLARWLWKPPEALAVQTQELKSKVVPSSGATLVKSKDAISSPGDRQ